MSGNNWNGLGVDRKTLLWHLSNILILCFKIVKAMKRRGQIWEIFSKKDDKTWFCERQSKEQPGSVGQRESGDETAGL